MTGACSRPSRKIRRSRVGRKSAVELGCYAITRGLLPSTTTYRDGRRWLCLNGRCAVGSPVCKSACSACVKKTCCMLKMPSRYEIRSSRSSENWPIGIVASPELPRSGNVNKRRNPVAESPSTSSFKPKSCRWSSRVLRRAASGHLSAAKSRASRLRSESCRKDA